MLLVANIINLGADLGAMGEALRLLVGGPVHLYVGSSVPRTEFALDSPDACAIILMIWVATTGWPTAPGQADPSLRLGYLLPPELIKT